MARSPKDPFDAFMKKRLEEYPDEFRPCRESRCWWDEKGLFTFAEEGDKYIVVVYRCERCPSEKRLYYDKAGNYLFPRYYRPSKFYFTLTDEEREHGFRFSQRTLVSWKVRKARGLDKLPE